MSIPLETGRDLNSRAKHKLLIYAYITYKLAALSLSDRACLPAKAGLLTGSNTLRIQNLA